MMLVILIVILLIGGLLAWVVGTNRPVAARWVSLMAVLLDFLIIVIYWITNFHQIDISVGGGWILEFSHRWIPRFGIQFHFALDGLSLIMLSLTFFLGILSVLVSWSQITRQVGFYHFNILWILAGISGVFLSVDLFLFYFFWEVMLIPMYFLIGIWGHENRIYAAYKFFIFTQASGLLMFISILTLYFIHGKQSGVYTFELTDLLNTSVSHGAAILLMSGFMIAFIVKLPAVPFHNWLPDAHTEAPTAGSVILAGLLLKTGAYGLLRFVIPLFPGAAGDFAPWGMLLGVIGILYGAKLAFSQTDLKRMVAYTSVSHMGFVMLGVFSLNQLAYQGVVIQMIAHGISTGALFIMVGVLQERLHTREIHSFSGLWTNVPKMGAMGLIFAMASLGLPGMGNFIAEFLILTGTYQASVLFTVLASLGLVAATLYSLKFFQQVFQGKLKETEPFKDYNLREMTVMVSLVIVIFLLGILPQPALDTSRNAINRILRHVDQQESADKILHSTMNVEPVKMQPEAGNEDNTKLDQ